MPKTKQARQEQPEQEKPPPLSCTHGQGPAEVAARWAQVEAMEPKPWPLVWCVDCSGPALAPENTDDWWAGIRCSRCSDA